MDTLKIKQLVKLMRRLGIAYLEMDGVKLSIDLHFKPYSKRLAATTAASDEGSDITRTSLEDEERFMRNLFWSSPGTLPNENKA